MENGYNVEANTYRGIRVEDIATMFEICVRQGVDFNDPKTTAYTAGFRAGIEYINNEFEKNINRYMMTNELRSAISNEGIQ